MGIKWARQRFACADLRFNVGFAKGFAYAHDFACRFHFWAKNGVYAREFDEGKHRFLDAEVRRINLCTYALLCQRAPCHAARCDFGQRYAGGFGNKRHGAAGAWIDFKHINHVLLVCTFAKLLDGKLHVHQPHYVECIGHGGGLALDFGYRGGAQVVWRQRAG